MSQTLNPFEKLLVELVQHNVQFMTVGGLACVMHGHLRATEDVDILVKNTPDNIQKLLSYLSNYGDGYAKELNLDDFNDEEGAIRLVEEFPIDIFTIMAGNKFEDFEASKKEIDIHGTTVPYISLENLIKLKSGSVRPKDKLDVIQLKQIQEINKK